VRSLISRLGPAQSSRALRLRPAPRGGARRHTPRDAGDQRGRQGPPRVLPEDIIEFNSYEEAMKNSNDPATTEFAQRLGALLDGPPRLYNLDVRLVEEM